MKTFCSKINGGWITENFTVAKINSQYNELVSQMRGSTPHSFGMTKQMSQVMATNQCLTNNDFIGNGESSKPRLLADIVSERNKLNN